MMQKRNTGGIKTGQKKPTHGGKRKGAGRKKGVTFKEPTKVRRVPVGLLDEVDALIERYKKSNAAPKTT